jgi:hypothetical protein
MHLFEVPHCTGTVVVVDELVVVVVDELVVDVLVEVVLLDVDEELVVDTLVEVVVLDEVVDELVEVVVDVVGTGSMLRTARTGRRNVLGLLLTSPSKKLRTRA